MPPTAFSADTLMFQFFMPGIDEELLIRGIMLALFERAFGQSPMSCRLWFGYAALITSLIFASPWCFRRGRAVSVFLDSVFEHGAMGRGGGSCSHSIGEPAVANYRSWHLEWFDISDGDDTVTPISAPLDVRRDRIRVFRPL
jgi:hypothetical protein